MTLQGPCCDLEQAPEPHKPTAVRVVGLSQSMYTKDLTSSYLDGLVQDTAMHTVCIRKGTNTNNHILCRSIRVNLCMFSSSTDTSTLRLRCSTSSLSLESLNLQCGDGEGIDGFGESAAQDN
jgi:hypothetical protein